MTFPKILIVGTGAFNRVTGGGITMSNLFSGWPKDRIATIHQDNLEPDLSVCENYFRLTSEEIRENLFGRILRGTLERTPWHDAICQKFPSLFNNSIFQQTICVSSKLKKWMKDFSPDIIYSMMSSNEVMELTRQIKYLTSTSLVIHFMDDWPLTIYRNGHGHFRRHYQMKKLLKWHIDSACLKLAISPQMAAEYSARYGSNFESFQNVIDVQRWKRTDREKLTVNSKPHLLYAGSIYDCAQDQSLIDICECVLNLNKAGTDIFMDIYSHEMFVTPYKERLQTHSNIHIHSELDDDVIFFEKLKNADILLLPVNFDRWSIAHIRLSMPTKIPALLCSGTPILVYGPKDVAQVKYAEDAGWGGIVSERDEAKLQSMIIKLSTDLECRQSLSSVAIRCAEENHDAQRIRSQFHALMKSCISN